MPKQQNGSVVSAFTIWGLPTKLRIRFKAECVKRKQTMKAVVTELMASYCSGRLARLQKERDELLKVVRSGGHTEECLKYAALHSKAICIDSCTDLHRAVVDLCDK